MSTVAGTGTNTKAALAAALAMLPAAARAESASGTMPVTAEVVQSCAVSTEAVSFGPVDTLSSAPVDAQGGVAVTCSNGTRWSAAAELGSSASFAAREMSSGANKLTYGLYTDPSRSSVWGTGAAGTATIDSTGSGLPQSVPVYGRIAGGQGSVPAGAYSDLVVITITY